MSADDRPIWWADSWFEARAQWEAELGVEANPVGLKSYKPYHSTGEDFLHNFIGMVGIPMDLVPEFPVDEQLVFLTESAKFDGEIVDKIKGPLMAGKDVVSTSGLLRALQGKGIEDIAELRYTDKKTLAKGFSFGWFGGATGEKAILFPQIKYLTNDSWELVSTIDGAMGYPILHQAGYANGTLYVLTIPDNFAGLYALPAEVLTPIKQTLMKNLPLRVESPGQVSLFF